MKPKEKITISWGTNEEETKTYKFETKEQLQYFMMGVDEAEGWSTYKFVLTPEWFDVVEIKNRKEKNER